ncbi:claudin-2-like [Podarcis raffonei]|uniref:claudin-2-like n=1 Tax=Podarcis raffonei TaxID=65483 RepID=UPI0023295E65|nr:claudin-2-like [Podarcis raffonei]
MPSIASLPSTKADLPPQAHVGSFPVRLLCRVSCVQLAAFLLAVLGCLMSICSTSANLDWRVWQVDKIMGRNQQGIVGIGIWGACSVRRVTMKKTNMICIPFNDEESLPAEIIVAQDLMPMASVANAVTVLWMAFALCNIFEPGKDENFINTFFSIGARIELAVGTCVLISIAWNLHSVLTNDGIPLPEVLGVPPIPTEQRAGMAIYIGFLAAASQLLSGTLVLGEKYFWKMSEINISKQKFVNDPESVTDTENPKLRMKYRQYFSSVTLECEEEKPTIWRRCQSHIKMETMPGSLAIWLTNGSRPVTGFF